MKTREAIAAHVAARLESDKANLARQFLNSSPIRYFVLDDLLPESVCSEIHAAFPSGNSMRLKKSFKELKYISAQMNMHAPILEESLFSFQEKCVVSVISEIIDKSDLEPDADLYAGGISMMGEKHFLNPHIDNSHDKDRLHWRNLNLLYYVSPDWPEDKGGNLELWPDGPKGDKITLHSKFNRLLVMETHHEAWHSVSPIVTSQNRCCVSNYYFAPTPMREEQNFHVTSFRGRPEQPVRDVYLQADIALRMGVRAVFKNGIVENKHKYQKD